MVCLQLMLLYSSSVFCQMESKPLVHSPQTADIIRFDNTSVSKNSGRLDLNVNLLTLEEADFKIPINISYNSSGYMPTKAESSVGLNWSLLAGGAIYRTVRNIPDDWETEENTDRKGFLSILTENVKLDKNQIFNDPNKYIEFCLIGGHYLKNTKIEPNSDIYNFSFGSYSGKFTIKFDGSTNVVSYSGGKFKIDISNFVDKKIVKIITDNGYVYFFGGSKDNMEYTYTFRASATLNRQTISSYHLFKITAPNGKELNIKYAELNDQAHSGLSYIYNEQFLDKKKDFMKNYVMTTNQISHDVFSKDIDVDNYSRTYGITEITTPVFSDTYSLTKVALISEIKTDFQTVKFFYSNKSNDCRIYDPNLYGDFIAYCGAQLDSINIYDVNSNLVKHAQLNYKYFGGQYSRYFLTEISLPSKLTYKFEYNHSIEFPDPLTRDVDYWGFWRNKGVNEYRPDFASIKWNNFDYILKMARDESAENGFDLGLLNKIVFPTGGSSEIMYEHHSYLKKIDKITDKDFLARVVDWTEELKAGGARVKSITNTNGNIKTKKVYLYNKSGIISNYPRYADGYEIPIDGANASTMNTYDKAPLEISRPRNGVNIGSSEMDHIAYSRVTETAVEGEDIVPEKIFEYVSSPLSDLSGEVVIADNLEFVYPNQEWTFTGMQGGAKQGRATFLIKKYGNVVSTVELVGNQVINYNPPIGVGFFQIVLIKTDPYICSLKILFPESGHEIYKGSYKTTYFSDYVTNPDNQTDDKLTTYTGNSYSIFARNSMRIPQSQQNERGQILREEYYNSSGILIRKDDYKYRDDMNRFNNFGINVNTLYGLIFQINKDYFYPYFLTEKTITSYDKNGYNPITNKETYTYTNDGYLKEKIVINSNNNVKKQTFNYPFDNPINVPARMIEKNILSPVIEENNYVNDHLFFKKVTNYSLSNDIPTISTIEKSYNNGPLENWITFNKYNCKGQPIYVINSDNKKTVYIWGYNYQYLVAEIENATCEAVSALVGDLDSFASAFVPNMSKIDQLRISLPNSSITSYTYKPHVGLLTKKDSKGNMIYYEYDVDGSLKTIKDNDNNIRSSFKYQYVNSKK